MRQIAKASIESGYVLLGMETSSQHVVDIDDLSASTEEELERLHNLTNDCCISRVHESVRKFNEHYYTPKVVSIGPIHHGKEELRAMEEYKKRYLKDFLILSRASLKKCYELVQKNETKLRNYYADPIELDSKDFVKMVLLDAVFLLMTLLYFKKDFVDMPMGQKRIMDKPLRIVDVKYDLVLLENQLPFFIIKELYKLSHIYHNCHLEEIDLCEEAVIITLAIELFNNLSVTCIQPQFPTKVEHLLALLRSCLNPMDWKPETKLVDSFDIPSIKELNQAGVKFKARRNQNLFDIEFNNGVLEIPAITVHGFTELLFRNLLAFEVGHAHDFHCIDYFRMMQIFTIASADSEVLIRNRIINNRLPDAQAVSTLFHNLFLGFVYDPKCFGYSDVIRKLKAKDAVPRNRRKATWKQRYFRAPWAIFSFTAVVLLLILTIVQTVCSILQFT